MDASDDPTETVYEERDGCKFLIQDVNWKSWSLSGSSKKLLFHSSHRQYSYRSSPYHDHGKNRMADIHKINAFIVYATLRILEGEEWKFWVNSIVPRKESRCYSKLPCTRSVLATKFIVHSSVGGRVPDQVTNQWFELSSFPSKMMLSAFVFTVERQKGFTSFFIRVFINFVCTPPSSSKHVLRALPFDITHILSERMGFEKSQTFKS